MPVLYIIAGPNGSGKTTYYLTALNKAFIDHQLPFINIDLIAKELGGYSTENFIQAEMIYREKVSSLISNGFDFMIESNLAKNTDYEWIGKMIKQGYEIVLFFLCTDDINIHIKKVQQRVIEGGHDIPVEIIIHRYKMAKTYLKGKLFLFKEIYFIDNSSDEAIIAAQLNEGRLEEHMKDMPGWVSDILFLFKKIKR